MGTKRLLAWNRCIGCKASIVKEVKSLDEAERQKDMTGVYGRCCDFLSSWEKAKR